MSFATSTPPARRLRSHSTLACLAIAALTSPILPGQRPDPQSALEELVQSPALRGARIGVMVRDLANGETLCAHDAGFGFMTASNMKLIASTTALHALGPDYRFETKVVARGPIENGVLRGDLLLIGSGDPTLGGRHEGSALAPLVKLAKILRQNQLQTVQGSILGVDDCQFDDVMGDGWSWAYQGAGYAAQPSGLCFAENVVRVVVRGSQPGQPPTVRLEPDVGYMTIANHAQTVTGKASTLRVERVRGRNHIEVRGSIPSNMIVQRKCSVENPTAYAAAAFRLALQRNGVRVEGLAADFDGQSVGARATLDLASAKPLARHRSPPLGMILKTLNKVSQNLYAEQLLRAAVGRQPRTMAAAAAAAADTLRELGGDPTGMRVADGSGLTRLNLVAPSQFADLLTGVWQRPALREVLLPTLPVAGIDGTLSSRYPKGPARGRVRAKTGYISRVVGLSGFVPRPNQADAATGPAAPLVFSILLNNFTCPTADAKAAVDRFVNALATHAGHSG